MKTLTVTLTGMLAAAMSMPALAGPNWDVIHAGEAHHFAHHGEEHVLPLDHGPRAVTTPWLNKVHEGEERMAAAAARPAPGHMVAAVTTSRHATARN